MNHLLHPKPARILRTGHAIDCNTPLSFMQGLETINSAFDEPDNGTFCPKTERSILSDEMIHILNITDQDCPFSFVFMPA